MNYETKKTLFKTKKRIRHEQWEVSHQYIKDIPLVDMDGDESFKFGTFNFCEVPSSLVNKCVEEF